MAKYVDLSAIIQVIGCVYNNPELLEEHDRYTIIDEDFADLTEEMKEKILGYL